MDQWHDLEVSILYMSRIRKKVTSWSCVAVCGWVVTSSGCLSYRTGGLPDAKLNRQDFMSQSKQTAYIQVACQTRGLNETCLGKNVAKAQEFRGILAKILSESEPFKSYTFSENKGTNATLRIVATLRSESYGSIVSLCLSAGTLTVIPTTGRTTCYLKTQVYDCTGKLRGEYEVKDSMRVWIQLLFITLGPWKTPEKAERHLAENLVRTTLSRIKDDGLLNIPRL